MSQTTSRAPSTSAAPAVADFVVGGLAFATLGAIWFLIGFFSRAIQIEWGFSVTQTSIGFVLFLLSFGVAAPAAGAISDRARIVWLPIVGSIAVLIGDEYPSSMDPGCQFDMNAEVEKSRPTEFKKQLVRKGRIRTAIKSSPH